MTSFSAYSTSTYWERTTVPTSRVRLADLLGGAQPFVRVGGRHADVDDGDVGRIACDEPHELVGAVHLADDVDSLLGEQSCEALADDDGVVGEDHAHGIAAETRVPPPRGLSTLSRPSSASTRSRSPRSPAPAASAPPIPSSVTSITSAPVGTRDLEPTRATRARA